MIKINLLPQELSGKAPRRASAPSEGTGTVVATALVFIAIVGAAFFFIIKTTNDSKRSLATAKTKQAAIKADLQALQSEWETLERDLRVLRVQYSVINSLDPEDRLLWTKKLNMLPSVVPDNVFLSEIKVNETVTVRETPESMKRMADYNRVPANRRTGAPPTRENEVILSQTLEMVGIAYSPENLSDERIGKIVEFSKNLQEKPVLIPWSQKEERFMDGFAPFSIKFNSAIEEVTAGTRQVSRFSIQLLTKSITVRPPAADAPIDDIF